MISMHSASILSTDAHSKVVCNLCLSPWATGINVQLTVTEKTQSLNCIRKWCLAAYIALRQGKGIKQINFFAFFFLKKKKSGRGSDIVLKRQYQVFLTVIILMPIRICSIFYVVRKYFFF